MSNKAMFAVDEGYLVVGQESTVGTLSGAMKVMPLVSPPKFAPNYKNMEDAGRFARGTAEHFYDERYQGAVMSGVTLEFRLDDVRAAIVLGSMLGGYTAIVGPPAGYSFVPPTSMTPAKTLSIAWHPKAGATGSPSWTMLGCMCTSLALNSRRGQFVKATAVFKALAFSPGAIAALPGSTWLGTSEFTHEDLNGTIGALDMDQIVYEFNLNISQSGDVENFNYRNPQAMVLGDVDVKGDVTLSTKDSLALETELGTTPATSRLFTINWASIAATGGLQFLFDGSPDDVDRSPQGKILMNKYPFTYGKKTNATTFKSMTSATLV